ncbi:MAG: Asp-tRNA(Asn)/Glu-tRNA(Gln) amidotransferase A subunit family amidase, partial [Cyclobacteriaceae bacterium]
MPIAFWFLSGYGTLVSDFTAIERCQQSHHPLNNNMIKYASLLLLTVCGICACEDKQPLDVTELTISEIHTAFKAGDMTAEQLTKAYLKRIEKYDAQTNAITTINPDALTIAKQLDAEYRATDTLRLLHGIPIIVKDNINTIGLPTTAGSLALRDFVPIDNAPVIQKLVDAGAIILAKSNMAEWAFSPMHSESSTHGTTRNPYNLGHVPAGSSGGTAASVASNFGTVGLGTDTGNSIRGPSSHCALVGFRTTLGLISRSGIIPLFLRNDVVGPMGRTVEDATRVMEVMAGIDPTDQLTQYSEGKSFSNYQQFLDKDGLVGTRVGVLRTLTDNSIDPEIRRLFDQSLADLETLGATVIDPLVIPGFEELRQNQWCGTFREDVETFLSTYVKRDTVATLEDIIRIGSNSEFASERLISNANHNGRWGTDDPCGDAYKDPQRIAFRETIERVMDSLNIDAIVYPSWNHKPASIKDFQAEYLGDNSQIISPHTGQP